MTIHSELQNVVASLRRRWEVSEEDRIALKKRIVEIATDKNTPPTVAVKAFNALIFAEALDLKGVQIMLNAAALRTWSEQSEREGRGPIIPADDVIRGIAGLVENKEAG